MPAPRIAGATILLVDDDEPVRTITSGLLADAGYSVLEAGSAGAALDLVERDARIGLVLLDFAMPGMNGVELARQVKLKRPAIPILFVTGFADRTALAGVSEAHIIGKPYMGEELITKIGDALSRRHSGNVVSLRK
jgi:CheY-like chemotaxis protein